MPGKNNSSAGPICSDFSSEKCPCFLAQAGKCFMCFEFSKHNTCKCKWSGFCIMLELNWRQKLIYECTNKMHGRIYSIEPVSKEAMEVVISGITLSQQGVVTIGFGSQVGYPIPSLYSYTDRDNRIHTLTHRGLLWSNNLLCTGDICVVKEYENPIVGSYIPDEGSALITGLGIQQVTVLNVIKKLRCNNHKYLLMLLESGPAYKYIKRYLKDDPCVESYIDRQSLFESAREKIKNPNVRTIYSAGKLIDYIRIIDMTIDGNHKYNMSFFDSSVLGKLK